MNTLPTDFQAFIHTSRYARWLDTEKRRETWEETVDRYMTNVVLPKYTKITEFDYVIYDEIREAILNLEIMPSMRSLMTAGAAMQRDNTCAYNCAYLTVDDLRAFDEAMFILLCGTGVGFSVERQYISKLPTLPEVFFKTDDTIVVQDSKEGWANALKELVSNLFEGKIPTWDVSKVRKAGARLKTFGGRASGPGPLLDLFSFVVNVFVNAKGRKLNSLECHDIMCKIGEVVVVGGVRRSAMISLSNLSDNRMRYAKSGSWWENSPYRALANNSVSYTEKPDMESFMREWLSLVESKSGERGIFNREASQRQASKNGRRDSTVDFGVNPCSEIILRPNQFCNLTEVVVKSTDTLETLTKKVYLASVLGTIQASYTDFPYLRDIWRHNTEEEALLGVSLTGIMDNDLTNGVINFDAGVAHSKTGDENLMLGTCLDLLKKTAINTNIVWSTKLGIKQSAAITCVKPSGTVSQLVDSASGIHPRHSEYYIRTVRGDNKDPLTKFMVAQGIPSEPDVMKPATTTVFSFPIKAPDSATLRSDLTALDQLKLWLEYQRYWCEHKPSITVNVRESEWLEVGAWVYKNFDEVSGISFLPYSDHSYQQAPYQEIDEDAYKAALDEMPDKIDWSTLSDFEKKDNTSSSQTFACVGDCELVDIS